MRNALTFGVRELNFVRIFSRTELRCIALRAENLHSQIVSHNVVPQR